MRRRRVLQVFSWLNLLHCGKGKPRRQGRTSLQYVLERTFSKGNIQHSPIEQKRGTSSKILSVISSSSHACWCRQTFAACRSRLTTGGVPKLKSLTLLPKSAAKLARSSAKFHLWRRVRSEHLRRIAWETPRLRLVELKW